MKTYKLAALIFSSAVLASCGGGGGCGASVAFGGIASPACGKENNILSKYVGDYFQCDGLDKTKLSLSVTGDKGLKYVSVVNTYNGANCTGSIVNADVSEGSVAYLSTGLANLPAFTVFPYAAVIDVVSNEDGFNGIYMTDSGQYISLLSFENGVFASNPSKVYSKSPNFNLSSLQPN